MQVYVDTNCANGANGCARYFLFNLSYSTYHLKQNPTIFVRSFVGMFLVSLLYSASLSTFDPAV